MKRRTRLRAILAVPLLLVLADPPSLAVDSHGYYCTARGILAFELRWVGPASDHQLHIVRYSEAAGIVPLPPIVLDDFQVFDMTCFEDSIEIEGSAGDYLVDLSDPQEPIIVHPVVLPAREGSGEPTANLGHWGRTGVVDLESDAPPGTFQLVIARAERPIDGGIEWYTLTRLVRRSPVPGRVESFDEAVALFEGVFLETVD
jgi:hypothetical protein